MLKRTLRPVRLLTCGTLLIAASCAQEVGEDPPVNFGAVTIAQFDPLGANKFFSLVPTPTQILQAADGSLDPNLFTVLDCEKPTAAQCLLLAGGNGWSTATPITLHFSRAPQADTIADGVKLYEATATGLVQVGFTATVEPRPAIPAPCLDVIGVTDPTAESMGGQVPDLVAGSQTMTIVPDAPIKAGTRYIISVESYVDDAGTIVGLLGAGGEKVDPTSLFAALNTPEPPVDDTGRITNALLRSQVIGGLLQASREAIAAAANKTVDELTDEEEEDALKAIEAEVAASGQSLLGLWGFFNSTIEALVGAGEVADRRNLVLVNTWTTAGSAPGQVAFDPGNAILPFPNSEVLTTDDMTTASGVRVNLPVDPNGSPNAQALTMGLNTLSGFSTTAPFYFNTTRPLMAETLDGNILMYAVDKSTGQKVGDPIPLSTRTTSAAGELYTVIVQPQQVLQQNARYVIAVTTDVLDDQGLNLTPPALFGLASVPFPAIDNGVVAPPLVDALQCSTLQTTGSLANDDEVVALATQIENDLGRAKFARTIATLTSEPNVLAPDKIAFAFSYDTQNISGTMDAIDQQLLAGPWQTIDGAANILPAGVDLVGSATIAIGIDVVGNLCVPLCQSGALGAIDCNDRNALAQAQLCQAAVGIVTSNLGRARVFLMEQYTATVGSPFGAGTFTPQTVMQPAIRSIPIWVVEPTGTAPAGGWPVVVFQHGLGQQKEDGFFIANTFAKAGYATVLMDLPFHGARASDTSQLTNTPFGPTEVPCSDASGFTVDPLDVTCAPDGTCTGGCDGVQDGSGTGFLSANVFGTRDNFRQGTIDQLTLLYNLAQEGTAGGDLDVLNGSAISYVGQSLGAITGGNLAGYADQLEASVLNVGGGGLVTILLNTVPAISAGLFFSLNQAGVCIYNRPGNPSSGCQDLAPFRQFLVTAQWALDPGDPLANSVVVEDAIGLSNVLMQISMPDPVVSNIAGNLLADSYGFVPSTETNDSQFQIYDFTGLPQATMGSGCHGFLLAPTCGAGNTPTDALVDTLCNTLGAQEQAINFIQSGNVGPRRPANVNVGGLLIPCP